MQVLSDFLHPHEVKEARAIVANNLPAWFELMELSEGMPNAEAIINWLYSVTGQTCWLTRYENSKLIQVICQSKQTARAASDSLQNQNQR
jgi:hypothetical protein